MTSEKIPRATVSGAIQKFVNLPGTAIALVGTVNGGVWRTPNLWQAGTSSLSTSLVDAAYTATYFPTWTPTSDGMPCGSIAALYALDANNVIAGVFC